jgi:hypothetical protein
MLFRPIEGAIMPVIAAQNVAFLLQQGLGLIPHISKVERFPENLAADGVLAD